MRSYNLESSDLPSPLGVKAHSSRGMAASKAFPALQRYRVVYTLTFNRSYDLDVRATPGSSVLLPELCIPHTKQGLGESGGMDISFP